VRRPRGDDGSVLLLVLGLTGVLLLAVALVVNVSAVILAKRALASAADGAAVSAAQTLDEEAFYASGLAGGLPLDPDEAASRVAAYRADVEAGQPGVQMSVEVDGRTAIVRASRTLTLPLALLSTGPVTVEAVARARAPVSP
jgi:Flp pilus assembly protein TadG